MAVLFLGVNAPILAQGPSEKTKASRDLKAVFDAEGKRLKDENARFDAAGAEKANARGQQKKGWSKNDKIFLGAFVVAVAVLVVLLVKYGKDCRRTNPPNCNLGNDEGCLCEEYEPSR